METEISTARIADIDRLTELLVELFTQEIEFKPDIKKHKAGLMAIIQNPDIGEIFMIKADKKIVGMISLLYTISTALGGKVALLEDMVLDKNYRNMGLGSVLIKRAIETAKERGCLRITLLTDHNNETAIRFYKRHGFDKSSMIPMRFIF